MPERIQRRRVAGQPGMPAGAKYVGRPGKWGNPFIVRGRRIIYRGRETWYRFPTNAAAIAHAVRAFRWQALHHPQLAGFTLEELRAELRGRDLACWCPPGQPCHADVLL